MVSDSDSAKADGAVDKLALALCGVSSFVDDIVTTLTNEIPYVEVTARLEACEDLDADLRRSGADVLLCALPEQDMGRLWRDALARRPPPLAVLNLVEDHSRGHMYAVYSDDHTVEQISALSLSDELRRYLCALRKLGDP